MSDAMKIIFISVLMLAALASAPLALAKKPLPDPAQLAVNTQGFLSAHPDMRWRQMAMEHYLAGNYEDALGDFMRSARFADKGSQAMVAEMIWTGQGTTVDRARGYAWMDLAAERGYKDFLKLREIYWNEMNPSERDQAIGIGQEIYAEYGDDVAKPRLARKINQGRRNVTGSRTGFGGNLSILVPYANSWISIPADKYYADEFWQPAEYFKWQDNLWHEYQRGRVQVGALEVVPKPDAPAQ